MNNLRSILCILLAHGGRASATHSARISQIEKEMTLAGKLDFALTALAVLSRSTARYWNF